MTSPSDVIEFWITEVGEARWYVNDPALDAQIRDQFLPLWQQAADGGLHEWLTQPQGALAYLILTDQMPRNMFRGEGRAFSTDAQARAAAKHAIDQGFDLKIDGPKRQFFYMPLMHSECLSDQDRCVRLMHTRMDGGGGQNLRHARAHREVIRAFGRFPARNVALDRASTAREAEYVSNNGYGAMLDKVDAMPCKMAS
ncbi:hypothetical protein ACMU_17355 [Actibacterium mucosum KCTC 23349]|uniref:DUF924 domain-containing protein n=1 Tax=Actibacterium mucosum KCTC 23349 TaxID=1454373 RepID=A0A037ZG30_9RHOB|nr:DUF924 family protein [Actibacterium mucosum]KAJ54476.1 hypothetical protein ACMU_17355 [Actibacterium mucosum KCTC 23349]